MAHQVKREEARRLRRVERMSLLEIAKRLGVAKSTVSLWLRDLRLTKKELYVRKVRAGIRGGLLSRRYPVPPASPLSKIVTVPVGLPIDRARIAEVAVLLRLVAHGMEVYGALFDRSGLDWVARLPGKRRLAKIQVRLGHRGRYGAVRFGTRRSNGYRKLRPFGEGDLDFLVGYDVVEDVAYVFTRAEARRKAQVSARSEMREAWLKLKTFLEE